VNQPNPPPPDQAEWDKAASAAAIGQLAAVRATAEKWAGTVTALLGVFSSVALLKGTGALADIRWVWLRWILLVVIVAAGVAAAGSIWFAALAAQGRGAQQFNNWNGDALRSMVIARTPQAIQDLSISRLLGAIAAGLVFAVGVVTLVANAVPKQAGSPPSLVVVSKDGSLHCGDLKAGKDGGAATVGGKEVAGAVQVLSVSSC
jgi:hypothetical protein